MRTHCSDARTCPPALTPARPPTLLPVPSPTHPFTCPSVLFPVQTPAYSPAYRLACVRDARLARPLTRPLARPFAPARADRDCSSAASARGALALRVRGWCACRASCRHGNCALPSFMRPRFVRQPCLRAEHTPCMLTVDVRSARPGPASPALRPPLADSLAFGSTHLCIARHPFAARVCTLGTDPECSRSSCPVSDIRCVS